MYKMYSSTIVAAKKLPEYIARAFKLARLARIFIKFCWYYIIMYYMLYIIYIILY